jgi:general stress protein 26
LGTGTGLEHAEAGDDGSGYVSAVDWEEVADVIRSGGVARMATAGNDGWPQVSQVGVGVEDDRLWLVTGRVSRKARNLRENPRASLMWTPRAELYLRATVEFDEDAAERERVWTSGLLPYDPAPFFGSHDDPDNAFVRLTPVTAIAYVQGASGVERRRWRP